MALNLVTGRTGTAHVTSDNARAFNSQVFGTGTYLIDYGAKFALTIVDNNTVRIGDGMLIHQGTQMGIDIDSYEDVIIENGSSGYNRNDLIVMRYTKNRDTQIESIALVVIKGTPSNTTAVDPTYTATNILDGSGLSTDVPICRVRLSSLTITGVDNLIESNSTRVLTIQELTNLVTSFSASNVTGVKGRLEQNYRTGNVNLTPFDMGALSLLPMPLTQEFDLDDIKTQTTSDSNKTSQAGLYILTILSSQVGKTQKNLPPTLSTSKAFVLMLGSSTSSTHILPDTLIVQIYLEIGGDGNIYTRSRYKKEWTEWKKVTVS
jgi:hypothetical protein